MKLTLTPELRAKLKLGANPTADEVVAAVAAVAPAQPDAADQLYESVWPSARLSPMPATNASDDGLYYSVFPEDQHP